MSKSLKDRYPDIYSRWFHQHMAERHAYAKVRPEDPEPPLWIRWANPNTCIYLVDYIFRGNTLFVGGDIGHAVYRWSQPISPEFVAGCDLDYFSGKMEAGDRGVSLGLVWQPEVVKRWMAEYCKDKVNQLVEDGYGLPAEPADETATDYSEAEKATARAAGEKRVADELGELYFWEEATYSQNEWSRFMHDHDKFFGVDDLPYDCGMDYDVRVAGHLIGLQLAVEQLNAKVSLGTTS